MFQRNCEHLEVGACLGFVCLYPDCLFGGFTARLERTLAITDESKREKKLSQTCTHTAASSYLLLPRQTEALHRNSSFTVEVNIFVPLFFFFSYFSFWEERGLPSHHCLSVIPPPCAQQGLRSPSTSLGARAMQGQQQSPRGGPPGAPASTTSTVSAPLAAL